MKLGRQSGESCEPFLRSVCFVVGSDKWTSLERKLFNKALATYSKDFVFVQKMVSMPFTVAPLKLNWVIVHVERRRRTWLPAPCSSRGVFHPLLGRMALVMGGMAPVSRVGGKEDIDSLTVMGVYFYLHKNV